MANQLIDAVIDDEATKTTIRNFRNVVFHVACPADDPYQLDFDASHVAPGTPEGIVHWIFDVLRVRCCAYRVRQLRK